MSRISRAMGPANHLRPYTKDQLTIIASYSPSWRNAHHLGEILGRTPHAIQYQWCKMYQSITKLKELVRQDPRWQVYLDIRKEEGLAIHTSTHVRDEDKEEDIEQEDIEQKEEEQKDTE